MTVKEFYERLGEDYNEVFERIGNDAWIVKYLKKFVNDGSHESLNTGFKAADWDTVFRTSHSMKGIAVNLGLIKLSNVSANLCETVRNGAPETDVTDLVKAVNDEYNRVLSAIVEIE